MDPSVDGTDLSDFIERSAEALLFGLDAGGTPRVACLRGMPGFAVRVARGTLALRLPPGHVDSNEHAHDRVALVLIGAERRAHLLLYGTWQELPAAGLSSRVRRQLGIPGRGGRGERIGILDVASVEWTPPDACPDEWTATRR